MTFAQGAWLVSPGLVLLGGLFLVTGVRPVHADHRRPRTWRSFPGEVVASVREDPADPHRAVVASGVVGGDPVGRVFAVVGRRPRRGRRGRRRGAPPRPGSSVQVPVSRSRRLSPGV